jgi:hypothetical protein
MTGFAQVQSNIRLAMPVKDTRSAKMGIEMALAQMILKYDQALGGVLVAFWNIKLADSAAIVLETDPAYVIVYCSATLLVFKFEVMDKLVGKVNKVGKDHLGMVVMDAFNVSVTQKNMGNKYVYSGLLNAWKTKDNQEAGQKKRKNNDNQDVIKEGSYVAFQVESINDENGYFSVEGSISSTGTGLVHGDNKGPVALEADGLSPAKQIEGASPKKKKRKE